MDTFNYTQFDAVSDALVNLGILKSDSQIWELCSKLPNSIIHEACEWGWNDTEVREHVLDYIAEETE